MRGRAYLKEALGNTVFLTVVILALFPILMPVFLCLLTTFFEGLAAFQSILGGLKD